MFNPYVTESVIDAVVETLRGKCITQGPKVEKFEKLFQDKFSLHERPVSLNSGTAALETAFEILNLQPGDEVITTPLTCTATNIPLLRRGVKIVWADIGNDLCIDPDDIRRKITPKTKAIVAVHLGGLVSVAGGCSFFTDPGDGVPMRIPVVSDAAQALGVFVGDYTCCSFQAIKHLTTVDGGMLVCPNYHTSQKAKLIRWFGIDRDNRSPETYKSRKMTFDIECLGTKRHMNDVNASMGISGLKLYDTMKSYRANLFELYKILLKDIPGITLVDSPGNVHWLTTVLVENRDGFAKLMYEKGIEVSMVHARNDIYRIFGGKREDLPMMNLLEDKYISLPLGMHVTDENVRYICSTIQGGW